MAVVGYEALARGPEGPLATPDALFAAARRDGVLADLDRVCRRAALRAGIEHGVSKPLWLFVNVEPEVLDSEPLDELVALADEAPDGLQVVLEITERALAVRPAELLRTVERVRSRGWRIALDDVGADDMSLAFMPLLRPEVVKLDLRLVRDRPSPEVASIMNAVSAYSESTGALVLAEGIENAGHLVTAGALGAVLGQGWMLGRPAFGTVPGPAGELVIPLEPVRDWSGMSPFGCLPTDSRLRRSSKPLLIEISKHLERESLKYGPACLLVSTFQDARFFSARTAARYTELVEGVGFVAVLGVGLEAEPLPGLRGARLKPDDTVRGEWDVVVLAPHFSAALLARDLGDTGPDLERRFDFAVTYDRDTVVKTAQALLSRVAPRTAGVVVDVRDADPAGAVEPPDKNIS
jgi:EAL domain-containing protein (putative c-di-GMP-specific phosphodiesterase class I)